jgi:hypothetical protein
LLASACAAPAYVGGKRVPPAVPDDVQHRESYLNGKDGVMLLTNVPFGGIAFPFGYYNRDDNLAGGLGGPLIVDGVKISPPVSLPGSHGLFQPVATAENWDGGVAGACNQYGFAFSNLAVRSDYKGAWQAFDLSRVLRDPAYQLTLGQSGFKASSRA